MGDFFGTGNFETSYTKLTERIKKTWKSPYKQVWLAHTTSSQEAIGSLKQDCELLNSNEGSERFMPCSKFSAFQ